MGCSESQERLLIQSLSKDKEEARKIEMDLRSQINLYEFEIKTLKEQVKKREGQESQKIIGLKLELETLDSELNAHKAWKSYQVLKNLIRKHKEVYRCTIFWGFNNWKLLLAAYSKDSSIENDTNQEIIIRDIDTDDASTIIEEENKEILNKSAVWELYLKSSEIELKLMPIVKLIRLFEDMMDLKYSQDLRDIEEKRKPKSIPEFMIDFLNRSFGLKNIAKKNLSQIIPVLIKNADNSSYLSLLCRFLHIHHPEPVGFSIGLFLIQLRIEFNNLINSKCNIIGKFSKETLNQHKIEGGYAFLSDVFVLTYFILESSRFSRSLILGLLKPDSITKESYFLFHICFKMSRIPLSPEELFNKIDINNEGFIESITLIKGLVRNLDLWISNDHAEIIYNAFDSLISGIATKEVFISRLNQKQYFFNCSNEKYMISKSRFLEAILVLYNKIKLKTSAFLLKYLKEVDFEHFCFEQFKEIIKKFETGASNEFIIFLDEEVRMLGNGSYTVKNMLKAMIEYGIGDKTLKLFGN